MKLDKILCLLLTIALTGCQRRESIEYDTDLIPVLAGEKYQFVDHDGKIIINPQFSAASMFWKDIALVATSGKNGNRYGFIDKSGKYIVNPMYLSCTTFAENISFCVMENSSPIAINVKGEIMFRLPDVLEVRNLSNGFAAICKKDSLEERWGFIDKSGEISIINQFNNVGRFSENKCAVMNDKKEWGYIDEKGKIVINYQFDSADEFENGRAIVGSDNKYGVIDDKGKFILKPEFEFMKRDFNGYLIGQNDKYGWCDIEGKILINPQFETSSTFAINKLAAVSDGDKFGYIDEEGKLIINYQFNAAVKFSGDIAIVETDGKFGFIDKTGKLVVTPQFDGISNDLLSVMNFDETCYNAVKTDYFDKDKLIKTVCSYFLADAIDSNGFEDAFSEILPRYDLKTTMKMEFTDGVRLVKEKIIVDGVKLDIFVGNKDAWSLDYRDYEWKLNASATPTSFILLLNFYDVGEKRAEKMKEQIEKKIDKMLLDGRFDKSHKITYKIADDSNLWITIEK